ncbi:MAG: hypothetical protein LBC88_03250 [Spirochaetaceae bacterium]|nr:hypothetical protein [Spirochaetaceae bacterium]
MRKHAGLLIPVLLIALFASCKSKPPPLIRLEEIYPLVPFTRDFVTRAKASRLSLNEFQYYISTRVILEEPSASELLRVTPRGDAVIQRRETMGQIQVPREREGVLVAEPAADFTAVQVYFDRRYQNYPFTFVESPVDYRYYLVWDESAGTLDLGGIAYNLRYVGDAPPYLMVRLREDVYQPVSSVEMQGVQHRRVGIAADWISPTLLPGSFRYQIPIRNNSRIPVFITSVRFTTDSPFISPAEIVQNVGEMEIGEERLLEFRIAVRARAQSAENPSLNTRARITLEFTEDTGEVWEDTRLVPVNLRQQQ